jgi:uncharacterized protein (TIGR02145 family)
MKIQFQIAVKIVFLAISIQDLTSCIKKSPPELSLPAVSVITPTTATITSFVADQGGSPVTSKGVCWNTDGDPTIYSHRTVDDGSPEIYQSVITVLTPVSTYYVRAYASNSEGIGYSKQISITTAALPSLAEVEGELISFKMNTANLKGIIISDGGNELKACGVCWSAGENPTISGNHTADSQSDKVFISRLTGLQANTKYFVRAYATTSVGTSYGNIISFTTLSENDGTVKDIDGNIYNVLSIGTQKWLVENLKTTRYNNGDLIEKTDHMGYDLAILAYYNGPTKYQWAYNGEEDNVSTYGRLYTWYTAVDSRGICPVGWHVPSDAEWHQLVLFLDPKAILNETESEIAGNKLKEAGSIHWLENAGSTNESGFTALPNGEVQISFLGIGRLAYWWTSSGTDLAIIFEDLAMTLSIHKDKYSFSRGIDKSSIISRSLSSAPWYGYGVRCVK